MESVHDFVDLMLLDLILQNGTGSQQAPYGLHYVSVTFCYHFNFLIPVKSNFKSYREKNI